MQPFDEGRIVEFQRGVLHLIKQLHRSAPPPQLYSPQAYLQHSADPSSFSDPRTTAQRTSRLSCHHTSVQDIIHFQQHASAAIRSNVRSCPSFMYQYQGISLSTEMFHIPSPALSERSYCSRYTDCSIDFKS
ncbi:hypothetical protein PR048_000524 [Dryococelus australis]|uniref:Uncharacterized protein n=1 Tax=Dryococelus australis TaxID=614101 RepID=A0ABQ9IEW2_9NEOP|nr:hypothetical protein PR048_000524 [Dryococelus australis]